DAGALADLVDELVLADRVAADEGGKVLVWTGAPAAQADPYETPAAPELVSATPAPARTGLTPAPHRAASASPAGERRQLTVMFCDLVGSTALSERLDPEDLHQLVTAYQQVVQRVMQRYEGHVAQYLGDGILAYFGYPRAHEDDPVRAVRAGLDILDEVARLELHTPLLAPLAPQLQLRLGLHTGPVVIGAVGAAGEGGRTETLALGKTPNIAARVQAAAEPGTLYLSGPTQRLVQGLFDCRDLGLHSLKGIAEPLPLHQVLGPVRAGGRGEAATAPGLITPLQGRGAELQALLQRWRQARAGQGRLATLVGEPGIGKSRLLQALGQAVADDGGIELAFRASPFHGGSALYPVVELLNQLLQFGRGDDPATRLRRLRRLLARTGLADRTTPLLLLARLLALPLPAGLAEAAASAAAGEAGRRATLAALAELLWRLAASRPVLAVFEDLHWADPSTLELLELAQARLPEAPVLLTLVTRPGTALPWAAGPQHLQLDLGRLGPADIARLAADVAGQPVPPEVLELLVSKTGGVPLYVRELTQDLLDGGLLAPREGRLVLTGPLPSASIPFSLQDSLTSRLDRLGPVRRLAELAAVLGREFSPDWLLALLAAEPREDSRGGSDDRNEVSADARQQALAQGLQTLCEADILQRQGSGSETRYVFRHGLLCDAAYHSLLKRRRQLIHARVAQLLETVWTDSAARHPELVAHHHAEAGQPGPALRHWERAALQAMARSAHREAAGHYAAALAQLRSLPAGTARDRQELGLLMALGVPLSVSKSWAAPEVRQAHERALALCLALGETDQLFRALFGVWSNAQVQADYRTATPLANQLLSLAERAGDDGLRLQARRAQAIVCLHTGQFEAALAHCDAGVALYDPARHHAHVQQYWLDPGVGCLCYGAWALACMGRLGQAAARAQQALALAEGSGHGFSVAYARHFCAVIHELRREAGPLRLHAQALLDLAQAQGYSPFIAWGQLMLGCARAHEGQAAEGAALIRQGQQAAQSAGARVARSGSLGVLAAVYERAGEVEAGLATVHEALAFVAQSEETFYEAELIRLRGALRLRQGAPEATVEADYRRALELARQQGALLWSLRAAISLARLKLGRGQGAAACHLLEGELARLPEAPSTRDHEDASALRDQALALARAEGQRLA
ncbi:MAG: hypothetical protein RL722_1206, partial [Pseudomonadota bacterium]